MLISSSFVLTSSLFAEETHHLPVKPDWVCVLPGKPVSDMAITSYGFAILTGEKMLAFVDCSCGKLIAQKYCGIRNALYLVSGLSDLIYLVDSQYNLHSYSPSGYELNCEQLKHKPIEKPLCASDGTVLVRSESSIDFYDIEGHYKNSLEFTDQKFSIPLKILPDGTFAVVSSSGMNLYRFYNCSALAEIRTFDSAVINLCVFAGNVYIKLANGNVEDYKIEKGHFIQAYNSKNVESACAVTDYDESCLFGTPLSVVAVSRREICRFFKDGIYQNYYEFVLPDSSCNCYNRSYLVIANSDWSVNGYYISASVPEISRRAKRNFYSFSEKYENSRLLPKSLSVLLSELKTNPDEFRSNAENYALLDRYADIIHSSYMQPKNITQRDEAVRNSEDAQKFMEICSIEKLVCYSFIFKDVFECELNSGVIAYALSYASLIGYDEGVIISCTEKLAHNTRLLQEPLMCSQICNSVFHICRTMGTPVLFTKGRAILSYLLQTQLGEDVKTETRNTLEKIIALQM